MIAGWILYCAVVGALLCLAAAIVDNRLTAAQRPARWVWLVAIAGMLAIPAVTFVRQARRPLLIPKASEVGPQVMTDWLIAAYGVTAPETPPSARSFARPRVPEVARLDRFAFLAGLVALVVALVRVLVDSYLLHRGRTRWVASRVDGETLLVSRDFGPAIVGLLHYAIVMPEWALALPAEERALVLAHESEHAAANDVRLTTSALFLALWTPWNPAMWYAVRRLRLAIEVDCDRRVLRAHRDVGAYGRLLVDMASRSTGRAFAVAGFSERAAPLVRRIRAMTSRPDGHAAVRFAATALTACTAVAAALFVLPPAPPAQAVDTPPTGTVVLPRNAGDSIAERRGARGGMRIVAAAADLPSTFSVLEGGASHDDLSPGGARCAQRLRDDRDGTILLNRGAEGGSRGTTQRNDTAWTRIDQFGFFSTSHAGRYGLKPGQLLRVGCGAYTRVSVGGRDVTLASRVSVAPEIAAKRDAIVEALKTRLSMTAEAVELRPHFLRIVIYDPRLTHLPEDSAWHRIRQIKAMARDVLGTEPDTISFTYHDKGAIANSLVTYSDIK